MDWSAWSLDLSLVYVGVAAAMYLLGGRRDSHVSRRDRTRAHPGWREASFFAGLAAIVVALDSPIDHYAAQLFWVHMAQHILLLTVAPPLILLGRPWPRMWLALRLATRATVGRTIVRARWLAPLRALAHPLPAWLLFNAALVAWHLPAAYDATLRSTTIHDCEHALFFFAGLLFWAQVIDPAPLRPRMSWPARAVYVIGAMIVGWVLAIVLVLVPHPIYSHYAQLAQRPGGITALTDQQVAGGMMWVPGSIAYTIAALYAFWRLLEPKSARTQPAMMT